MANKVDSAKLQIQGHFVRGLKIEVDADRRAHIALGLLDRLYVEPPCIASGLKTIPETLGAFAVNPSEGDQPSLLCSIGDDQVTIQIQTDTPD